MAMKEPYPPRMAGPMKKKKPSPSGRLIGENVTKPYKRIGKAVVPKSSKPKPPSNTTYPPASSHKQLAPRPKQGSKAALLPYQGPKRNSKRK